MVANIQKHQFFQLVFTIGGSCQSKHIISRKLFDYSTKRVSRHMVALINNYESEIILNLFHSAPAQSHIGSNGYLFTNIPFVITNYSDFIFLKRKIFSNALVPLIKESICMDNNQGFLPAFLHQIQSHHSFSKSWMSLKN